MRKNSNFYLVTGFHRSGTSLLAQTLAANGMYMGDELMGATFSNPLGHMEDMPIVRLHDKIYHLNGADWRYHDTSSLIKPVWLKNYIENYVLKRLSGDDKVCGVKDPRAVHFLEDWKKAGQQNIKFIFIYRHWRSAAHSLLNRHSRHLINNAHAIEKHVLNFSFWKQATLAYEMWLSANHRICDFIEANASDCLLISQEGLITGDTVKRSCASKISLSSSNFKLSTFNSSFTNTNAPTTSEAVLSGELYGQLERCYMRLQSYADLPDKRVDKKVCAFVDKATTGIVNVFENAHFDFSELSWPELSGAFLKIPKIKYSFVHYKEALKRENGSVEEYQSLAKVAHLQGQWVTTRVLKIRACMLDCINKQLPPFDIFRWLLFTEQQEDWLTLEDRLLANPNPFSLRVESDLHERFVSLIGKGFELDTLYLNDVACDTGHEAVDLISLYLSKLLLVSEHSFETYLSIARIAKQHDIFDVEEFAYFKALRLIVGRFGNTCIGKQNISSLQYTTLLSMSLFYERIFQYQLSNKVKEAIKILSSTFDKDMEIPSVEKRDTGTNEKGAQNQVRRLRHRFAVLPHAFDYKKILSIGYEKPLLGAMLDKLNSRLCFLCKDNVKWLNDGLDALIGITERLSLKTCIQNHWQSLWPSDVYLFLVKGMSLNGQVKSPENPNAVMPEQSSDDKLATNVDSLVFVYDFEPSAFKALYCLLAERYQTRQVHILVTQLQYNQHKDSLTFYHNCGCQIEVILDLELQHVIKYVYDLGRSAQWVCLLHCSHDGLQLSRQRLVLNWYSALGGEQSFEELYSKFTSAAHMALPSYPPWVINDIQDKPFYYPLDSMFWLNEKALCIASNIQEKSRHLWFVKLLHTLKDRDNSISFVHQYFLEHFQ